jgi:hypothetical protein
VNIQPNKNVRVTQRYRHLHGQHAVSSHGCASDVPQMAQIYGSGVSRQGVVGASRLALQADMTATSRE